MDNINDTNGTTGHNGNRGKFSDRLKKIRRDRLKKKIRQENIFVRGIRDVFKIFLAVPSVVYSVIKEEKKDEPQKRDVNGNIITDNNMEFTEETKLVEKNVNRRLKVNKIREIDVEVLKKQQKEQLNEKNKVAEQRKITLGEAKEAKEEKEVKKENERLRIEKLQKEILDLIKKKLVKNINELEMLQSELFVLKEVNGDDVLLKECQEDIKEIKKLLSKIKTLKEKYDYLKDTVDFEYLLEYGDDLLIDKILELKEICTREDIVNLISDYKILEEYKYLYLKIDQLQENAIKYDDYKKEQELELKERDVNFDSLKNSVYDANREKERYEDFVKKQELFLRELERKIQNIDAQEQVKYKLVGFNKLVGNSFKYVGLMLMSPLKGLFPSIATQTVITKNIIHNLYNNLELKEQKKMVYSAVDYSTSINMAINNIDSTLSLVNSTFDDVVKLKEEYKNKYSKYESSIPGYAETIKKINKMENAIMGSKIKIEIMKQRMREKERQNENKMKKVKKLNSLNNN